MVDYRIIRFAGAVLGVLIPAVSLGLSTIPAAAAPPADVSAPSTNILSLRYCSPHWQYVVTNTYSQSHWQVPGALYKNYNGTPYTAISTFTSTLSGTIGVTTSIGGTIDVNAVLAGAQVTTSVALDLSTTAGLENSIAISVPPHMFGYGSWGVWEWYTAGTASFIQSNCYVTDRQTIWTKVPELASGWNTYVRSY